VPRFSDYGNSGNTTIGMVMSDDFDILDILNRCLNLDAGAADSVVLALDQLVGHQSRGLWPRPKERKSVQPR
jgi:hypothetical protein